MSFGIPELLVILVIVLLLFGTKKLKSLGSDLGSAIKGFRKAVSTEEEQTTTESESDALEISDAPKDTAKSDAQFSRDREV